MYIYTLKWIFFFFYLRLWKHDHRSPLYFTYGMYVCMWTCIHTCGGAHAAFQSRPGPSLVATTDALGTRLGQWLRTGHNICEFSAILSRQQNPQIWRKARRCGFAKGWYFVLCVCVSFFYLSPHPPSLWSIADALYVKACNFVLVWGFPLSLFTTRNYTMLWFHKKRERGRERDHSVKSIKPWSLVCSSKTHLYWGLRGVWLWIWAVLHLNHGSFSINI